MFEQAAIFVWLKKATRFRWVDIFDKGWEARFDWAEVSSNSAGFSLKLCSFEDSFSLNVHLWKPNFFIKLPFLQRFHREPFEGMESWGFGLDRDTYADIHFNWGRHYKIISLPWARTWVRTSHLMADGTWRHETAQDRRNSQQETPEASLAKFSSDLALREASEWKENYPYTYTTKRGVEQNVVATVTVNEHEWRRKWLRWTGWRADVQKSIDVAFSKGVGENVDSWKGGCYGTGCEMLPGETPEQTLRRMEQTVRFR